MTNEGTDYAELVRLLRNMVPQGSMESLNMHKGEPYLEDQAADAIETLVKEVKWREDETAHEVVAARDCEKHERARAEAAEAEVARLREALTKIASNENRVGWYINIARTALEGK